MDPARKLERLKAQGCKTPDVEKFLAFHDECLRALGGAVVAYRGGDVTLYRERLQQASRLVTHIRIRSGEMFDKATSDAASSLYVICERRLRRAALVPHVGMVRGVGELLERIIEVQLVLLGSKPA